MKKRFWTGLLTALLLCAGLLCAAGTGAAETIDLPDGLDVPSLEECQAFDGWDDVNVDENSSVFYMNPRGSLPYRASLQFLQGQQPGVGFQVDVTGTEADPRTDKESEIGANFVQFHYWAGDNYPSMIWVTTSYINVSGLFDDAYIGLYYDYSGQTVNSGYAMVTVNGEFLRLNYMYGWSITEEAKTMLNADGLMEQRLAWLYAYQPKPLTIRKTAFLSIYDLLVRPRVLNLPAGLQEISSQAFIGVNAERAVIPPTVQTIADDAFDEGIFLMLPDSRLEDWAKEKHPKYWIEQ